MKLKDLLKEKHIEQEEEQTLDSASRQDIAEMVAQYNKFGNLIRRQHSIQEIAESLAELAESAEKAVLSEMDDWFDKITVNRNMKELKKLANEFMKEAKNMHQGQQRIEVFYEDMGNILNRYFDIKEEESEDDDLNEGVITEGFSRKLENVLRKAGYQRDYHSDGAPREKFEFTLDSRGQNTVAHFYDGGSRNRAFKAIKASGEFNPANKGVSSIAFRPMAWAGGPRESIKEKSGYDLGFGSLGSGLTVWDRSRKEHGDL